jgi:hypothetical protein
MSNGTDKQWIDAIGSRISDALSCADLDIDTRELVVASCQLSLMMEPRLLQQFKQGNSLIESDYFENFDDPDTYPKYIEGKNNTWRMKISMLKKPILKKRS